MPAELKPGAVVRFMYRTVLQKATQRRVQITSIEWGSTSWHHEPCMLLRGFDEEWNQERLFAVPGISHLEVERAE